jgi:hypothetical protein
MVLGRFACAPRRLEGWARVVAGPPVAAGDGGWTAEVGWRTALLDGACLMNYVEVRHVKDETVGSRVVASFLWTPSSWGVFTARVDVTWPMRGSPFRRDHDDGERRNESVSVGVPSGRQKVCPRRCG